MICSTGERADEGTALQQNNKNTHRLCVHSMFINNRNQCIAPFSSSNDNHWDMMAINRGKAKTSILLWLTNNQLQHLDARKEATKEATKGYVMLVVVVALVGSPTAARRGRVYHGFFFFVVSLFLFATLSFALLVVETGSCALPPPRAFNDNTHTCVV